MNPAMVVDNQEPPSGFQALLGYRLAAWEENHATLELDIAAKHLNRAGVLHGGVAATLLDTACGFAATYCPHPGRVRRVVTLSLTTHFTSQISLGRVQACAHKFAGGARIVFCRAELRSADGALIGTGEGTFRYRSGSETAAGMAL